MENNSNFGKKNLLLIIDAQRDFCEMGGPLYIIDSGEAVTKLCEWIKMNKENITDILLTQDSHGYCNICHPAAWNDKKGNIVDPFTTITAKSVENGTYTPAYLNKEYTIKYLKRIESLGGSHKVWPVHCLDGSSGAGFPDKLTEAMSSWSAANSGKTWKIVKKGQRNEAEMYSVFSYADGSKPEFDNLLTNIAESGGFNKIFVAGFAKDICVAYSVQDMRNDERFRNKLVFLDFAMTAISEKAKMCKVYQEAVDNFGAKILKSEYSK